MERIESSLGREFYSPRKIGKRDYSRNCSLSRWITSRNVRIIPSLRKYTLQSAPLNAVTGPIQPPRIKDKYENITRRPRETFPSLIYRPGSPSYFNIIYHRESRHPRLCTLFVPPSFPFPLISRFSPPPPLFDNFSFPVTHLPDWWWLRECNIDTRVTRISQPSILRSNGRYQPSPPLQDKKRLFDNS